MTNKLPILATAQAVYRQLYDDTGYAIKIAGSLIVLTLALPLTIIIAMGGNWVFMAIAVFGFPIGWLFIAVLWHRRYLCGGASNLTLIQLFCVSLTYALSFLITSVLTSLVLWPVVMFFLLSADFTIGIEREAKNGWLVSTAFAFSALVCVMAFFRINLVLPAKTVGNIELGIFASWRYTRGNALRLLCVWMLVAFPPIVLTVLCFILGGTGIYVYSWIELFIRMSSASVFLSIALLNTFSLMSIAYAFLVEKEAIPASVDRSNVSGGLVARQ